MIDTLDYIAKKLDLDLTRKPPIEVPNFWRELFAPLFAELEFNTGAEIGVQSGTFSEVLCKANPKLCLYSIDPWIAYAGYSDEIHQSIFDKHFTQATEILAAYNCVIIRETSMRALAEFADGSLDFVYIDGNHEIPWVLDDICGWSRKVRTGGIVAGHDYYRSKLKVSRCHVVDVVHCVVGAWRINPWFIISERDGWPRSWFWVKE